MQWISVNICLWWRSLIRVLACDVWRPKLDPVGNSNPVLCIFWLERWRGVSFPRWAGDQGPGERRRVRLQMFTIGSEVDNTTAPFGAWHYCFICPDNNSPAQIWIWSVSGHRWAIFQNNFPSLNLATREYNWVKYYSKSLKYIPLMPLPYLCWTF